MFKHIFINGLIALTITVAIGVLFSYIIEQEIIAVAQQLRLLVGIGIGSVSYLIAYCAISAMRTY